MTNQAFQTLQPSDKLPAQPAADAPLADWALWNAEVGRLTGAWKVFPCRPGEKRPLRKGWQDEAANDPKTIKVMWQNDPKANIGLAIQPGFAVIDGDLYKPGAEEKLAAFEADHGELPDTLESCTARGGMHLVYRTERTLGNGQGTLPDFGDVRGHGGLIVGPGSEFEGKRYTVETLRQPVALPKHIEGMLRDTKHRDPGKPDTPAHCVLVDDPDNRKAFADWCAGISRKTITTPEGEVAKPCIENQGGNNMLAATGAMAHDYGISEDVATQIAYDHFNPRCEPPWSDEEFDMHFRSGYRSATGQLGSRAPRKDYRSMFSVVVSRDTRPDAAPEGNKSRFLIVDRDGIEDIRPPEWLVPDFLPQDAYAMVLGGPSTFKTFIALDIALSIATSCAAGPWGKMVATGPVLFAVGEGRSQIKNRVKAWEKEHWNGNKAEGFYLASPVPLVSQDNAWEEFIADARVWEPEGYKLVVLDTVGRAMQGVNENAQEHASKFTRLVDTLRHDLGATVLALHHAGKDESRGARGSSVFSADADTVVSADRNDKDKMVSLKMTKQKDAPEWDKPKLIQLNTVHLSPDDSSLVAVKPTAADAEKAETAKPRGRSKHDPRPDPASMDILDKAVVAVLEANPSKHWFHTDLAEALAMREEIELSSSHLRTRALKALREDSSRRANKFYDPMQKRWRWRKIGNG